MKGYVILGLISLLLFNKINAQSNDKKLDKKIDELIFLYVDEKYDKMVYKAISLGESDAYKKNPLPFIYASMGYFQISKRPDKYKQGKGEEFEKALKTAQKYLYTFNKKDSKANEYYNDYLEFYDLIADTSNKVAQHFFLMEDYRKAAKEYKNAVKSLPNDPILLLWEGICEVKSNNFSEGDKNILLALDKINKDFVPSDVTAGVLAHGMLIVSEYFAQKGDVSNSNKAGELVQVFKKFDPDELDKAKMQARKDKAKDEDKIMRIFYSDEDTEQDKKSKD